MENNYYVPLIEEFHYGFEFERNEAHRVYYKPDMPVEYKWVSKKWDEHQIRLGNLKCEIFSKNIRVKYLTVEDIKSLGFSYTGKSIDIWFKKEGIFEIGNWRSYEITLHYSLEDHRLYIDAQDTGCEARLFEGYVKNKSELSKLLKQLDIS